MTNQTTAATPQPDPQPGQENVGAQVLADIQARIEMGQEKYGTVLQTFNGRDALEDAYQEAIDLVMYLKQEMMEKRRNCHTLFNAVETYGMKVDDDGGIRHGHHVLKIVMQRDHLRFRVFQDVDGSDARHFLDTADEAAAVATLIDGGVEEGQNETGN